LHSISPVLAAGFREKVTGTETVEGSEWVREKWRDKERKRGNWLQGLGGR